MLSTCDERGIEFEREDRGGGPQSTTQERFVALNPIRRFQSLLMATSFCGNRMAYVATLGILQRSKLLPHCCFGISMAGGSNFDHCVGDQTLQVVGQRVAGEDQPAIRSEQHVKCRT